MPINFSTQLSSKNILLALLSITTAIICTGLYEAEIMPKDEKVVSALSLILLFAGLAQQKNFQFINTKVLSGFILFNLFFTLRLYFSETQDLELKTYFIHIISLGAFIAIFSTCMQAISFDSIYNKISGDTFLSISSMLALCIILLGQTWQLTNDHVHLLSRPGGFLNPNVSSAIALMLLFTIYKLSIKNHTQLILLSTVLTSLIILLSQSRSAILVLVPFALVILFKLHSKKYIFLIFLISILLASDYFFKSINLIELIKSISIRFEGESSSHTRLVLLQHGWQAFLESPLMGNGYGYRHTYFSIGYTTHNQILEVLTNFGLIGLFILGIAFYFLYLPFSLTFLLVCVAPTLLFSSNFFDAYAIQASLALALTADRYCNIKNTD